MLGAWIAPLASPSMVIVGTVMGESAASRFQVVIFPLAVGQAKPPAIVVHHDVNMVGVVEGSCCAVIRGIVEIPLWRSLVPDELTELVEVFRIAGFADWSGEIVAGTKTGTPVRVAMALRCPPGC